MSEKVKLLIIGFFLLLFVVYCVTATEAQPQPQQVTSQKTITPLIAGFYTSTPCNPMLPGEVQFFSHSTGSPQTYEWVVTYPDGTTVTSTEKTLKIFFSMLGEYQVSLTVTRILNGITETDSLEIPGYVKVIDNPLNLHPPQSLREN